MLDNTATEDEMIVISVPGSIKVDILGTETIEFKAPPLRLSGIDMDPEQMSMLQVMVKLISQLNPEQTKSASKTSSSKTSSGQNQL